MYKTFLDFLPAPAVVFDFHIVENPAVCVRVPEDLSKAGSERIRAAQLVDNAQLARCVLNSDIDVALCLVAVRLVIDRSCDVHVAVSFISGRKSTYENIFACPYK